eukprot:3449955-Rhodomonas_salina.2
MEGACATSAAFVEPQHKKYRVWEGGKQGARRAVMEVIVSPPDAVRRGSESVPAIMMSPRRGIGSDVGCQPGQES